jgi:hypothetical protein
MGLVSLVAVACNRFVFTGRFIKFSAVAVC